jgi:hypothetical protein
MAVAAAAMAPAVLFVARLLEGRLGTRGLTAQLATGLGPVVAGVVVYGLASLILRLPDLDALLASARPRRPDLA